MAPQTSKPPLRVHKATQQCYVNLNGRRQYLGKVGSPDVELRYTRTITEWRLRQCQPNVAATDLTVVELSARFLVQAREYYVDTEGKLTKSFHNYRHVLKQLTKMYGDLPACQFGPLKLKALRQAWIGRNRARKTVNDYVGLIRSVFRWGVSESIVPVDVHTALTTVAAVRRGRSKAREREPVRPVSEALIFKVCEHLPIEVAAMLKLQLWTACRPGELVIMRPVDLAMDEETDRFTQRPVPFRGKVKCTTRARFRSAWQRYRMSHRRADSFGRSSHHTDTPAFN